MNKRAVVVDSCCTWPEVVPVSLLFGSCLVQGRFNDGVRSEHYRQLDPRLCKCMSLSPRFALPLMLHQVSQAFHHLDSLCILARPGDSRDQRHMARIHQISLMLAATSCSWNRHNEAIPFLRSLQCSWNPLGERYCIQGAHAVTVVVYWQVYQHQIYGFCIGHVSSNESRIVSLGPAFGLARGSGLLK